MVHVVSGFESEGLSTCKRREEQGEGEAVVVDCGEVQPKPDWDDVDDASPIKLSWLS